MQNITTPPALWSSLPATKLPVADRKLEAISVGHLNVRLSIATMIIKLVLIESLSFAILLLANLLYWDFIEVFFTLTIALVVLKIVLSVMVILQWLNEYYEITPTTLIHKKGILFKKEQRYVFSHLMSVDLRQSFMGRLLNFGSIHIYDRYINKDIDIYLIHNPLRCFHLLKQLIPYTDSMEEMPDRRIVTLKEEDEEELS